MTPKKMYDFITQHMSAEDALLKLLEGTVVEYKKLKFEKGKEIHPTILITMAAMEMDWTIAFPTESKENKYITGMITGTEEYVDNILKKL